MAESSASYVPFNSRDIEDRSKHGLTKYGVVRALRAINSINEKIGSNDEAKSRFYEYMAGTVDGTANKKAQAKVITNDVLYGLAAGLSAMFIANAVGASSVGALLFNREALLTLPSIGAGTAAITVGTRAVYRHAKKTIAKEEMQKVNRVSLITNGKQKTQDIGHSSGMAVEQYGHVDEIMALKEALENIKREIEEMDQLPALSRGDLTFSESLQNDEEFAKIKAQYGKSLSEFSTETLRNLILLDNIAGIIIELEEENRSIGGPSIREKSIDVLGKLFFGFLGTLSTQVKNQTPSSFTLDAGDSAALIRTLETILPVGSKKDDINVILKRALEGANVEYRKSVTDESEQMEVPLQENRSFDVAKRMAEILFIGCCYGPRKTQKERSDEAVIGDIEMRSVGRSASTSVSPESVSALATASRRGRENV